MREEMFTDSQGRRVRKKHAIRDLRELPSGKQEQLVLWVDISDATGEQMLKAFQYRRRLVLGDCTQLKTDVDSYNEKTGTTRSLKCVLISPRTLRSWSSLLSTPHLLTTNLVSSYLAFWRV
jgi:hypothetical protein